MARFQFYSFARDKAGNVLSGASVSVYQAGTTTAVKVWDAQTGGSSTSTAPQTTTAATGLFSFWIDDTEYASSQLFKIVVTSGTISTERDNVRIVYVVSNSSYVGATIDATEFTIGNSSDEDQDCEYRVNGATTGGYDPPALKWNGTDHKWQYRDHQGTVKDLGGGGGGNYIKDSFTPGSAESAQVGEKGGITVGTFSPTYNQDFEFYIDIDDDIDVTATLDLLGRWDTGTYSNAGSIAQMVFECRKNDFTGSTNDFYSVVVTFTGLDSIPSGTHLSAWYSMGVYLSGFSTGDFFTGRYYREVSIANNYDGNFEIGELKWSIEIP